MFNFTPLQGALSNSPAAQYLLELDGGVRILIGLGWDESFDPQRLQELERLIQSQSISLILLTHATVGHLAAFAHCCKNFPRFTHIPVYATRPVAELGRALVQDLYDSAPLAATVIPDESLTEAALAYQETSVAARKLLLQSPTVDELAKYFNLIQRLKYSQPHQPLPTPGTPPLNGLTITAYNSGRTLGGTIWHIQHGLESIVHAVDWNQARENVFAGAAWLGGAGGGGGEVMEQLRKPTALICSSKGAEKPAQAGGKAKRDEQLLDMIKLCVSRGGTALIPVDSSARMLELAYLLEHAWRESRRQGAPLSSAKVYLTGKNMSSTIRYARTMIEWMDDNINREFEAAQESTRKTNGDKHGKDGGPFDFKFVKILERKAQVQKLLAHGSDNVQVAGRVILASDTSLEWGFSKKLLMGLARDSRNVLLLTEKPTSAPDKPSLAETMWNWWKERTDGVSTEQGDSGDDVEFVYAAGRELDIEDVSREALQGDELRLYQHWLAQRQLQEDVQAGGAVMGASTAAADDASSESSSDSEDSDSEQQGKALNFVSTMGARKADIKDEDLGVNIVLKKAKVFDFEVEQKKGRDRMYPLVVRRKKTDNYGEVIRPEDFQRAEEKGATAGDETHKVDQGPRLGKKRKWGDAPKATDDKRPTVGRAHSEDAVSEGEVDEIDTVEDMEPDVVGPARLVTTTARVTFNLRIAFVDFSGIHDKRSLNMLLPLIQPRKLVLVGGSESETMSLAADCRKLLATYHKEGEEFVFTPSVGKTVNASVDTNAWTVRLDPILGRTLNWQDVGGGLRIATVMGEIVGRRKEEKKPSEGQGPKKRQKVGEEAVDGTDETGVNGSNGHVENKDGERDAEEEQEEELIPSLELPKSLPPALQMQRSHQKPIFVGDVRLADLRRSLQAGGYAVEFRGEGTLLVEGCVLVRKAASGRVEMTASATGVVGRGGAEGFGGLGVPDIKAAVRRRSVFSAVQKAIYQSLAVVGA